MATAKAILWPDQNKEKKHTVKICINVGDARKYISLKFAVKKSEWNGRRRLVRSNHPEHVELNDKIKAALKRVEGIIDQTRHQNITAAMLFDLATGRIKPGTNSEEETPMDFFAFVDEIVERLESAGKMRNAENIRVMANKLYRFILKRRKRGHFPSHDGDRKSRHLPFSQINLDTVKDFQSHLQGLGNRQTTVATNLSKFRKVMNDAVDAQLVEIGENPFFRFKIDKGKHRKKTKLTVEELTDLFNFPTVPGTRMWDAQNIFRFQFYTGGTRVGDCLKMQAKHIVDGRLMYEMQKTDESSNPKLSPKALEILGRYDYDTKGPEEYIFPFLDSEVDYSDPGYFLKQISAKTSMINKKLKSLAKKVGIEKPISTHVARHSMADFLRKEGHDLYAISKTLGHSSIKITEGYLASMDQDVVDGSIDALAAI